MDLPYRLAVFCFEGRNIFGDYNSSSMYSASLTFDQCPAVLQPTKTDALGMATGLKTHTQAKHNAVFPSLG